MFKAVVLLCALGTPRPDCTPANNVQMFERLLPTGHPAACFFEAMAFAAGRTKRAPMRLAAGGPVYVNHLCIPVVDQKDQA